MADFISLHREEWVSLITGLEFSAMATQTKVLFTPVVIVILGFSLLIWLYRLERENEWNNFILWLIFSSIIIISAFKTQKVVVEFTPAILNSKSMLLNPNVNRQNLEVDEKGIRYKADASGVSALLAIPDKIASLMFNFMDVQLLKKLAGQSNTVPLDNVACRDPKYLTGVIHMVVLSEVFSLTDEKGQKVEDFEKKVEAFEGCYRANFKGKSNSSASFNFSGERLWRATVRGVVVGGAAGTFFTPLGTKVGAAVGGVVGFFAGLSAMVDINAGNQMECKLFVDQGYRPLAEQLAKQCKALLGQRYDEKKMVESVISCITRPESTPECNKLKEETLKTIEYVKRKNFELANLGRDGWWGNLKDAAARGVSDLKSWWFSTTYMDFPLKFDLLAKGQGIVLALLTGMFPFVAVLSVIPTGRHFMNWPLLLNFMIAYFLVKMWIPLLFFIVNLAAHKLGGFAVGG